LVAALLLLAVGCASTAPVAPPVAVPPPPVVVTPEPPPPTPPPAVIEPPPAPAEPPAVITEALVEEATRLDLGGSPGEAEAAIERAIRVEPQRGELWLLLAQLRLRNGTAASAEQTARKALLFLRRGSAEERAAWLLIADARTALGDADGARAIREEWDGRE